MDKPDATGTQIPVQVPPIDTLEREKFEFEKEQRLVEAARLSEELKIKQQGVRAIPLDEPVHCRNYRRYLGWYGQHCGDRS